MLDNLSAIMDELKQQVFVTMQCWTLCSDEDHISRFCCTKITSFMLQCNVRHFAVLQTPSATVAELKQQLLYNSPMLDTL